MSRDSLESRHVSQDSITAAQLMQTERAAFRCIIIWTWRRLHGGWQRWNYRFRHYPATVKVKCC